MTFPRLIANRADASNTYLSSGSATRFTFRTPYRALAAAHSVRLVFANARVLKKAGEVHPADAVTVKASFEGADGSLRPVTFGGLREGTMLPGETITSDAIPVTLARDDAFFVRSRPLVDAPGKRWGTGGGLLTGGHAGGAARSGQDLTETGDHGAFLTSGVVPFGPAAILGLTSSPAPVTGIILGDSTAYGSGDAGGDLGDYGFLARTLSAAGIPHARLATPAFAVPHLLGAEPADLPARTAYHRALIGQLRPTHAFVSLGNNDVHGGGATLAGTRASLLRYFDFLGEQGLGIVACTLTPRTAGNWTSLAGQVRGAPAVAARRRALNDWLRARPHGALLEVWDVAAIAEEPTDPDLWRADGGAWTNDGTHMSPHGHASVARLLGPLASRPGVVATPLPTAPRDAA